MFVVELVSVTVNNRHCMNFGSRIINNTITVYFPVNMWLHCILKKNDIHNGRWSVDGGLESLHLLYERNCSLFLSIRQQTTQREEVENKTKLEKIHPRLLGIV